MAYTNLDLSLSDDVIKYLVDTPFASTSVTPLSGGNANFTFRLQLAIPYDNRETLVLKHGKTYVASIPSMELPLERQYFEVEALRRVKKLLPPGSLVTVPTVHLYDKANAAIIMDDCGPNSTTLKALMLGDTPDIRIAQIIGTGLGSFLATVHKKGSECRELVQLMSTNKVGKELTAHYMYGALLRTFIDQSGRKAVISPPVLLPQASLDKISEISANTMQAIMAEDTTYTMGDFWPGNILVSLGDDGNGGATVERILVVDWEVTKTGLTGIDIGQFCGEMNLLRKFHPKTTEAVSSLLSGFLNAYIEEHPPDNSVVKRAAVQVYAHAVNLGPRIPWGTQERTREVVLEALEEMFKSYDGDPAWLKECVVGPLYRSEDSS